MALYQQLSSFEDGHLVNCELGLVWMIFIGRLVKVAFTDKNINIEVDDVQIFDLGGQFLGTKPNYTLDWVVHSEIRPIAPLDVNGRLSFFLPFINARVIIYPVDQGRPSIALAMAHLKDKRYF